MMLQFGQLNLIEEKRMAAVCHMQLYQRMLKKAFDKKVHPRHFEEGDLVLKNIMPIHKDPVANGPQTTRDHMS